MSHDGPDVRIGEREIHEAAHRLGGVTPVAEFSRDLDLWASQKDVVLDFSRPGKPSYNSFMESFNGSSGRSG